VVVSSRKSATSLRIAAKSIVAMRLHYSEWL